MEVRSLSNNAYKVYLKPQPKVVPIDMVRRVKLPRIDASFGGTASVDQFQEEQQFATHLRDNLEKSYGSLTNINSTIWRRKQDIQINDCSEPILVEEKQTCKSQNVSRSCPRRASIRQQHNFRIYKQLAYQVEKAPMSATKMTHVLNKSKRQSERSEPRKRNKNLLIDTGSADTASGGLQSQQLQTESIQSTEQIKTQQSRVSSKPPLHRLSTVSHSSTFKFQFQKKLTTQEIKLVEKDSDSVLQAKLRLLKSLNTPQVKDRVMKVLERDLRTVDSTLPQKLPSRFKQQRSTFTSESSLVMDSSSRGLLPPIPQE